MRLGLKKSIVLTALLTALSFNHIAHADDDVKLKRGCVKDYPIVEGESDPELLKIYSQVCDKKNKENKNSLLVSAATKFQQLGKNDKALQIVKSIESQNIQSNELTDVKFLAGIGIAYEALNKMRTSEMRYLTADGTYPVAKNFTDAVKQAAPSSVLVEKHESSPAPVATPRPIRRPVRNSRPQTRPVVQPKPPAVKPKPATPSAPARPNFPT